MSKMQDTVRKSMKMDVNLASKDPLKFIDAVLAHHQSSNQNLRGTFAVPVQE